MRNCACCNTCIKNPISTINLSTLNDIILNNTLNIFFCSQCNFYYTDSDNNQNDYDNYYKLFNNYKNYVIYSDKDEKTFSYLKNKLQKYNIKNILDYGSGNGKLKELLSTTFNINEYDIGMPEDENSYDCLILSHVLEHIYNINEFIIKISNNINQGGLLYIEVPNAEFYNELNNITPLQEINIEHINFFSKFSLNKLLSNFGYYTLSLTDDFFNIKDNKYYVIRGIFGKNTTNLSFVNYINNGINIIDSYNFSKLVNFKQIYIYGCGQFLFKIFKNIQKFTKIINIIDDNLCYSNKFIDNISIINFEKYKQIAKDGDTILLTTLIYDDIIKLRIKTIDQININILSIKEL